MKLRLIQLCVLLLLCPAANAFADSPALAANSRISSVTVYADRALVTRTGSLSLQAGSNLVSFAPLPATLWEDSLRAEGTGAGRARISGITVKSLFLERLQEKRIRELEGEIQGLQRRIEGVEAKRKALVAQRAFIDSIRLGWGERISKELTLGKPSLAELGEATQFVGDRTDTIEAGLSAAEAAKKPLLEQLAARQKELEQARGDRGREVRSVEVAIEADRAMELTLTLSYLVGQAHWEPGYDLRLGSDGSSAELTYRAQVWQKSGEDWPGVKLSLSSARPEAGGAPPELSPWQVAFYEPPRPVLLGASRAKGSLAFSRPDGGAMAAPQAREANIEQMEPALPQPAQVEEGQTSVLFNITQPVDIPADGTRAASVIAVATLPVSAEFLSVPKLSPRVYLKSEVVNQTGYPLLAGQVNIFNDAVFTGKSYLKTVAAGEKFDLFFGADDQLKVKREVVRVRRKAGLLSDNQLTYHCAVELENFKKRAVTVSLLDQLPLAANAEIKASLDEARPKPDETKPDGTLIWKVGLAPGEKKKIAYDIVIEYPRGRELAGTE